MASVSRSFIGRGFSAVVADMVSRSQPISTYRVYDSCLNHCRWWYLERGVDPAQAPITEVASFLDGLLAVRHKGNPLAPTAIAGYRSAIVAIHQCVTDGPRKGHTYCVQ